MLSLPNSKLVQTALFVLLALNLAAFTASAQKASHVPAGQTADVSDVVKHPGQYMGKQVTVQWKVDRVFSPSAIGLEKNEKHLLVVSVEQGGLPSGEKKGEPITATGMIRNFDQAQFEKDYGKIDFGNAPLAKFENKPVLVIGGHKTAKLEQPTETTQPETTQEHALPRTASSLPGLGLAGLIALIVGLGVPRFRRQS
jgi:hypothetical protein